MSLIILFTALHRILNQTKIIEVITVKWIITKKNYRNKYFKFVFSILNIAIFIFVNNISVIIHLTITSINLSDLAVPSSS